MTSSEPGRLRDEQDDASDAGAPWGAADAPDAEVDEPADSEREFDARHGGPGLRWQGDGGLAGPGLAPRPVERTAAPLEGEPPELPGIGVRPFASAPRRASAWVIDYVFKTIMLSIVVLVAGIDVPADPLQLPAYLSGLWYSLDFMYKWLFYRNGWTPGARILHMRIVRADGRVPGGWGALVRTLGTFLSEFAFFIGYAWMLRDKNRQTWHDKMAGTYIVMAEDADYELHRGGR